MFPAFQEALDEKDTAETLRCLCELEAVIAKATSMLAGCLSI